MALFEEGFGPDHISDMTAGVILANLLSFNARILERLPVPRQEVRLRLRNGKAYQALLPVNPYLKGTPAILLVPGDILRNLPVVKDWSDISDAVSKNEELRSQVNNQIAQLWTTSTGKDKAKIRRWALSGKEEFGTLLAMIRSVKGVPYDMVGDPRGELFWREVAATLAVKEPFALEVRYNFSQICAPASERGLAYSLTPR
jgi:hypothetical protein